MECFTILASGSAGNASLLEVDGFGLLIDCGLPPRTLTYRLRSIGSSWEKINAVILTHTHGDHWKDRTFADLRSRNIPIYAHAAHLKELATIAPSFEPLAKANLTRTFSAGRRLVVNRGLMVRPIPVSHDAEPTFAFRIDRYDARGLAWSVGYASDLGCGSHELIEAFAGVDVLALEYNHDVRLEHKSRRPQSLIERVLSDRGHLSNDQAAELTAAIAERSGVGFPSHLVQLHLSRECNHPSLASASGRASLATLNPRAEVITARQDTAAKSIPLQRKQNAANRNVARDSTVRTISEYRFASYSVQPSLPGFDE